MYWSHRRAVRDCVLIMLNNPCNLSSRSAFQKSSHNSVTYSCFKTNDETSPATLTISNGTSKCWWPGTRQESNICIRALWISNCPRTSLAPMKFMSVWKPPNCTTIFRPSTRTVDGLAVQGLIKCNAWTRQMQQWCLFADETQHRPYTSHVWWLRSKIGSIKTLLVPGWWPSQMLCI